MSKAINQIVNSNILTRFKQENNIIYTPNFGIDVNSIKFWRKNVEMQYVTFYVGSHGIIMYGEEARTVLYSMGDRDHQKFRDLNNEELAILQRFLDGDTTASYQSLNKEESTG